MLELQKELLKLVNSKKDYNGDVDEIDRLQELKQNALVESAEREFLEQQSTEVTEYDELLVRLIEKVRFTMSGLRWSSNLWRRWMWRGSEKRGQFYLLLNSDCVKKY